MADRCDQGSKSHDERAGADCCLEFHSQESRKHHKHHHAAPRTHKTGAKTDSEPEEQ